MQLTRSLLSNVVTALLLSCAVTVTTLAVRSQTRSSRSVSISGSWEPQPDWLEYKVSGHLLGQPAAKTTLVEFADFECPACSLLSQQIALLVQRRPNDVAVLFRHLPLPSHRFSRVSAIASECAAVQGRFGAMHDSLFSHQKLIGLEPWTTMAANAGVSDTITFAKCMKDSSTAGTVDIDASAARRLQSRGTPTLLFESLKFTGVPTARVLDSMIDAAIQRKPS